MRVRVTVRVRVRVRDSLLRRGDHDAANDGDEHRDLRLGLELAVDGVADDDGEGGLGRLHDLAERDRASRHRVHGASVRRRRPEAERRQLHHLSEAALRDTRRTRSVRGFA